MEKNLDLPDILHVDDSEDFLELFRFRFKRYFNIVSKADVEDALEYLKQEKADLIITDYEMPRMNGLEFLKLLRKEYKEIPVIFYTGQGNEEVAREAFMLGASDYFTKDFAGFAHKEKIINSIKRALEIKKSKIQRKLSEEKFRNYLSYSPQGILVMDLDGNFVYANDSVCESMGYTREEVLNMNLLDISHKENRQETSFNFRKVIDGVKIQKDVSFLRKDGRTGYWSVYGVKLDDERVIGFIQDITSRKEQEEKLRFQSRILEQIQDKVVATDLDGKVTYVNKAESELFRKTPDEMEGMSVLDFGEDSTQGATQKEIIEKTLSQGHWRGKIVNFPEDGKEIILDCRTQLMKDVEGKPLGMVGISTDVTEIRKHQKRIEHLNSLLLAIRNINQLIVQETELEILMKKVCESLVETRSYMGTTIALLDEKETEIHPVAGCGVHSFRADWKLAVNGEGEAPECIKQAVKTKEVTIIKDLSKCNTCKYYFYGYNPENTVIIVPFNVARRVVGLLFVAASPELEIDEEETELLKEVVSDLVFAQSKIKMEQALKQSEEKYRLLAETARDFICIHDNYGNIKYLNQAAKDFSGYSEEEFIGLNVNQFVVPEKIPEMEERQKNRELGDKTQSLYETEFINREGVKISVEVSSAPVIKDGKTHEILLLARDITQRKKAFRELNESKKRLKLIIEGTNAGTWEWYVQTGKTIFNKRWAQMLGYELHELEPVSIKTWENLCHPVDLEETFVELKRHFKKETDLYVGQFRMKHKDGHWVWIQDRGKVVEWGSDGKPIKMAGIHLDVTDRKLAEENLKESEKKYRDLVENIHEIIFKADENGVITYISPVVEQFSGYSAEEVEGKNFEDFICSEDAFLVKKMFIEILKGKEEPLEYRVVAKSGKKKWVRSFSRLSFESEGRKYIQGILVNIDNEKRAKRAIERSLEEIKVINETVLDASRAKEKDQVCYITGKAIHSLIPNSIVAVSLYDPQKKSVVIKELFGPNQLINIALDVIKKSPGELRFHPEKDPELFKIYTSGKLEKVPGGFHTVIEGLLPEDICKQMEKHFGVNSVYTVGFSLDNIPCGGVTIFLMGKKKIKAREVIETITGHASVLIHRLAAEEKARKANVSLTDKNRELNDFTYRVSHDLKAPMNMIKAYISLIREDPERFSEYFEKVENQIDKLMNFIEDILQLSRFGRRIARKENIDLRVILKNIVQNYKTMGEPIEINFQSQAEDCCADPQSMELLFANLVQNSIKYRNRDKKSIKIKIRTSRETDGSLTVRYKDNGQGMKEGVLEHIFDFGFTSDSKKGTGLGLSIVKKIMEAHHGDIQAKSKGRNKGAEFIMRFPEK